MDRVAPEKHNLKCLPLLFLLLGSILVREDRRNGMGKNNVKVEYEKSLGYLHPELLEEWSIKNEIDPFIVFEYSGKKFYWNCRICDYEWLGIVSNRVTNRAGCPACAGKAVTNRNRFSVIYPESAKEWHPTKNGDKTPDMFSHGSHKEFWWLCGGCGNEWFASIKHKRNIKPKTCPICTFQNRSIRIPDDEINKIVEDAGYTLLNIYRKKYLFVVIQDDNLYKYDVLLNRLGDAERGIAIVHKGNPFSFENIKRYLEVNNKSFELVDTEYVATTDKLKFHCFVCDDSFLMSWSSISSLEYGCPCCTGHQIGELNNLFYLNPELCEEWHEKNEFSPNQVTIGSAKKAWWKCKECGNSWETAIASRARGAKSGCPLCAKSLSKGNRKINEILANMGVLFVPEHRINECRNINPLPFDFYLQDSNLAIEYQGRQHYEPVDFSGGNEASAQLNLEYVQQNDEIKRVYCEENNLKLLIIPYWDFDNIEEILCRELNIV